MKTSIFILLIILFCSCAGAEEQKCTKEQALEAEKSVLKLNSWHDIYKSFKKYRHCDDGAIAEGYSESIMLMLAHQWNQLNILDKLVSRDKDFYVFVIRHIDATGDKSELEMIIQNSSKKCSKSATKLCLNIENAAKEAMRYIED